MTLCNRTGDLCWYWYALIATLGFMLGLLLPTTTTFADEAIIIPPARVVASVEADGPVLRWWQASNADLVIVIERGARGDVPVEVTKNSLPGTHELRLRPTWVHASYYISEFRNGEWLGYYGPFKLEPARTNLPTIGKR